MHGAIQDRILDLLESRERTHLVEEEEKEGDDLTALVRVLRNRTEDLMNAVDACTLATKDKARLEALKEADSLVDEGIQAMIRLM